MSKAMRPRARKILSALKELGGTATTRQIAEKAGFNVNGVSQTLGLALSEYVECLGGERGEIRWKIKEEIP